MGGNRAALYFQVEMMHGYGAGDKVRAACDITAMMLGIDDDEPEHVFVAFGDTGKVVEVNVDEACVGFDATPDAQWWVEPNWIVKWSAEDDRTQWVILQLVGQRTVAGRAQSSNRWGQNMIMLEVPATGDNAPFTRFYAHGAIYAITPVSEAVARVVAAAVKEPPVESRFMKDGGVS